MLRFCPQANILIDKGTALVADFGLSAVMDDIRSRSAQSSIATSVRGTPQWMAPECHKGKPPVKASDIYSLGLTMWEVSAFQFEKDGSSSVEALHRHLVGRSRIKMYILLDLPLPSPLRINDRSDLRASPRKSFG